MTVGCSIPRTVARCEQYLDFLARVIASEGDAGQIYIPLYERLLRELSEAQRDESVMSDLRRRLNKAA